MFVSSRIASILFYLASFAVLFITVHSYDSNNELDKHPVFAALFNALCGLCVALFIAIGFIDTSVKACVTLRDDEVNDNERDWCFECRRPMPLRSRHCKQCGVCIGYV